jgi:hypothetical protein
MSSTQSRNAAALLAHGDVDCLASDRLSPLVRQCHSESRDRRSRLLTSMYLPPTTREREGIPESALGWFDQVIQARISTLQARELGRARRRHEFNGIGELDSGPSKRSRANLQVKVEVLIFPLRGGPPSHRWPADVHTCNVSARSGVPLALRRRIE